MTEDQQVAPSEATDEALVSQEAQEVEQEEGQEQDQPAEGEGKPDPEDEKKSASKERRERDKAYKARLREEREAALSQAAAAEAKIQRIKAAGEASSEPKERDFADYTEFVAAKAIWMDRKGRSDYETNEVSAEAKAARDKAEQLAAQERQLAIQAYSEAVAEATTRYADYNAVVGQPGLFPHGSQVVDLVLSSEAPADVAYEIAKDRALHDRLLTASPVEAMRIIGRIEGKLSAPPPRSKTSAPSPITPVRGPAASGKDFSKMSHAEYTAWREAGGTF